MTKSTKNMMSVFHLFSSERYGDMLTSTDTQESNWVALVTMCISMSSHPVNLLQTASI